MITTWYRPPDDLIVTLHKFENTQQLLDTDNKESIILGDVDCDLLMNDTKNPITTELNFIIRFYQYKQVIIEATREMNVCKSLIDHFHTTTPDNTISSGVEKITISNHYMIYGVHKFPELKGPCKIIEIRNFKHFNEQNFLRDLASTSDLNLDQYDNRNTLWLVWKYNFTTILDKHLTIKKRKEQEKGTLWVNNNLIIGKRHKNYLKKKATKTMSSYDWKAYKIARNQYNRRNK